MSCSRLILMTLALASSWGSAVGSLRAADVSAIAVSNSPAKTYVERVAEDRPTFWWRFEDDRAASTAGPADKPLLPQEKGSAKFAQEGPRSPLFPLMAADNQSIGFDSKSGPLRYADPGDHSPLDFTNGDSITIEAWVKVLALGDGQQMYIIGKGRTKNPGFAAENQNYALRLSGEGGRACLSFLFRDEDNRDTNDYHRWNSVEGFGVDQDWHHLAVTYTFGVPESIRGYLDGAAVTGKWDYGGATKQAPVVDNDELWIGSALGGNASNSFRGSIDEVAIYRTVVPADRLTARFSKVRPPDYVSPEVLPESAVLVEIFEGIPNKFQWSFSVPTPSERWEWPAFALTELPQKYQSHGVRDDRTNPLMVRLSGLVRWPAGPIRLQVRSRSGAVLKIDGKQVCETPFPKSRSDGHEAIYPIPDDTPTAPHALQPGDQESVILITATGQPQRVEWDLFLGGNKRRPELGESVIVWSPVDEAGTPAVGQILGYAPAPEFTNEGWDQYRQDLKSLVAAANRQRREASAAEWSKYWDRRHADARATIAARDPLPVPDVPAGMTAANEIDRFIAQKLAMANVAPLPLTDEWSFLRRATLDLIGITPTPDMVAEYFADPAEARRAALVDRLLEHSGWADHWVAYWQDALAENPNVINPTLNNTGPFRWWIWESFQDNKPFDRFATELILMEGSTHYGGPAGFALATQNDAPMAAKAHVLAQAFLGMEMKCARCHDAPYHDFKQKDLFSLAAMLERKPVSVPKSSTIPGDPAALQSLLVKVTLKPGEAVPPEWPFADELSSRLTPDILQRPDDRREQLAALITSANNTRFGQVLVNRVWRRYLGRGIVEPVDDWEHIEPSHPELLDYLERSFVDSGYDLKQLARLILNSHTYQRRTDGLAGVDSRRAALFAGPSPRRLSAEQLVDSLFTIAGKPFNVEDMNIDVDGMRSYEQSLNLGEATRAWQFTSLSNERDRPSLSLPAAQSVVDVLETFGWRSSRPDPVSVRPTETTVLQPAVLANGVVARRITQLSDDSRFTEMALSDATPDELLKDLFVAILTRPPRPEEIALLKPVLEEGYAQRRVSGDVPLVKPRATKSIGVSWSNHLKPEASERKLALKQRLDAGDPTTKRLHDSWRERAEDVIWSILNSPEFVFTP